MAKATKNPQIVQITDEEEKKKALANTLSAIEKQYGKGAIMKLGERTAMNVQTIPTGCLELDIALGVGGVPRGRIIEIYGPESSGKTTVALHMVAEAQKLGGWCAPARWTSSSSTRSRRSCPRPRSTATWATATWACRRA